MPALQVRDFPEELYEELRNAAERDHRSIAQQTIHFVEAGLRGTSTTQRTSKPARLEHETRAERIERRRQIFQEIDEFWQDRPAPSVDPSELFAEVRAEADERAERSYQMTMTSLKASRS